MKQTDLRTRLLRRKTDLSQRLHSVEADLRQRRSADWSEQAQERENEEVLEEIAGQCRADLSRIERTLQRMDSDDYGICTVCGKPIADERLRALPDALTCIGCAPK